MVRAHSNAIVAAVASCLLVAGACSNDEAAEERRGDTGTTAAPSSPPTAVTSAATSSTTGTTASRSASSTVALTSAVTTTASVAPGAGPEAHCTGGESPSLFAYAAATGELRWTTCTAGSSYTDVIGVTVDLVYAVLTESGRAGAAPTAGRLVALDVATGAERWTLEVAPFEPVPAGPLVGTGTMIVGLGDSPATITGVDAATGSIRWQLPGELWGPGASTDSVVVLSDPSVMPTGAVVVTTGADGKPPPLMNMAGYSAFDRATGAKLWTARLEIPARPDDTGQAPFAAVSNGIAVLEPAYSALDLTTGTQVWAAAAQSDAPGGSAGIPGGGPVGGGGLAVFGGQEGPVTALDIATGAPRWTAPGRTPYDMVLAIDDGALYVLDGGDIVGYELADGSVRWRQPQDPQQRTSPFVADDSTLFSMWWNLEARDPQTGAVRWSTDYPTKEELVDGPRMTSIASNGDIVAVGFVDGSTGGD